METSAIFSGIRFASQRIVDRFIVQPHRERQWKSKRRPFEFTNGEGLKFLLDPREYVDRHIFKHGIYEKRFLEYLCGRFRSNAIALDIGANIGNHAIYLAQIFKQVHAFEPNPHVLPRLIDNISRNNLDDRIAVHAVGLGKKSEKLEFRENNSGNVGASGFLKPGDSVERNERVFALEIAAADEYIASLGLSRIDFVKIDVEGWEPPLFEGLRNTISKYRPVIAFEFHGQCASKDDYSRICSVLTNYIIAEPRHADISFSFMNKLRWNFQRRGHPQIVLVRTPESRTYENILAFPDEQTANRFRNRP